VQVTSIITLPRSLEGLGGGFDAPKAKCPPDRGSSDCVRGSSASYFAGSPEPSLVSPYCSPLPASVYSVATPAKHPNPYAPPRAIPIPRTTITNKQSRVPRGPVPDTVATPPLTPDNSFDGLNDNVSVVKHSDALDILAAFFPNDAVHALPYAKRVAISSPEMGASLDGVVLELPGKPRTLYVDGKSAAMVNLRESIVALLDLADECFECSALVIALEKASPSLGDLLHSLMYVGCAVVTKPPFQADPTLVLVGIEI